MKNLFLIFYNFFEDYIHLRRIKVFLSRKVFLKKPIIFDVGSHEGKLVKLMNDLYENATIYCFEPNKSMNGSLKKVGKNIKVYNYALGSKNEVKNFLINQIDLTNTLSKINQDSIYLKIKNMIINKSIKDYSYKKIKVRTSSSSIRSVNESNIRNWKYVKSKFCKVSDAKRIFDFLFDNKGHHIRDLIG